MRLAEKEQLKRRYRRRRYNADMKNREFNKRSYQQDTKLRRYNNHRTNISSVDRSIISEQIRIPSPVQHYHLWHNGQSMIIPKGGTQIDQQKEDEEFIDYSIEIKDYNHMYKGMNYPYELYNQEDHHSHIIKNKPKK